MTRFAVGLCDWVVSKFGVHGRGAGLPRPAARQCDGRKQVRAAGATITLTNDATRVVVARVTGADGRYLFDFVDPGTADDHRRARRIQEAGTEERPRAAARRRHGGSDVVSRGSKRRSRSKLRRSRCSSIPAAPTSRWSGSSSIRCRSPGGIRYSLASLDPTITATLSNENRPHHHAYANDYDAGGGTRRANDVLLDGVAARGKLQDGLHAGRGRGRGNHGLQEQRGRGERPQPRRRHQPEHEIGHE